jgi:hypothetical protein
LASALAFALEAGIQSPPDFRLTLRILFLGSPAEVIGQFETVFDGESINGSFQFCDAHGKTLPHASDFGKCDSGTGKR